VIVVPSVEYICSLLTEFVRKEASLYEASQAIHNHLAALTKGEK